MPVLRKTGDEVLCKIHAGTIISAYSTAFDFEETFIIAAFYSSGYLAYSDAFVPLEFKYRIIKNNYKQYNLHEKFIDTVLYYINDTNISKVLFDADGMACKKCGVFFPMAAPNNSDGTLTCFICRTYPY